MPENRTIGNVNDVNVIGLSLQAAPTVPGLALFRPPLIVPGLPFDILQETETMLLSATPTTSVSSGPGTGAGIRQSTYSMNNCINNAAEQGNYLCFVDWLALGGWKRR